MTEPDTVDFLVVGGGTCGCVVAARLSEDASARVMLVESGSGYRTRDDIPAALADPYLLPVGPHSRYTSTYPVELTSQRSSTIARGHVLGGSGAVNGAYFARATRSDFDRWPAAWSYDSVLPYFCKSETDHDFGGACHGDSGPIPVERTQPERMHPWSREFFAASVMAGFPEDADKNAPDSRGIGPVPLNISRHRRVGTAVGYLLPALNRPNLDVIVGTQVRRIVFAAGKAVGVEVEDRSGVRTIGADHVMVCAGAVETPLLLLRSGIGPAGQLAAHDVSVVVDRPGVGANFVDHPEVLLPFHFSAASGLRPRTPVLEVTLNLDDLEIRPYTATFADLVPGVAPMDQGIGVVLMNPESRGSIELGADLWGPPRIRYNYLESDFDRRRVTEGMRIAEELLESTARCGFVERPTFEYSDSWIESHTGTSLHLSGSAVMGAESDPAAVVDADAHVIGVDRLSIVDTSILPAIPSRGPHATAVMVAERVSAALRGVSGF